eukprot:gene7196-4338_t
MTPSLQQLSSPGPAYATCHATLREGESLSSQQCGMLRKGVWITVAQFTANGRAQLGAPPDVAGRWVSVIARDGAVIIAAPVHAAVAQPPSVSAALPATKTG